MKNVIKRLSKVIKIQLLKIRYERKFITNRCQLKYLFFANQTSKKLLVVFSAFPGKGRPATYNYIKTFKHIKCNKVYILDNFGPDIRGGSYYLGKNKDFFIEEAVSLLIKNIADHLRIEKKDIITAGTSKGGFAALYFALKYNYGAVISGAPQIFLGNYLKNYKGYFEYITGEFNECNRKYLNNLLFELVNNSIEKTKIYLHVSKQDHHYSEHVIPFCDYLESKNITFKLEVKNYGGHEQVGKYFPSFALKYLNELLDK